MPKRSSMAFMSFSRSLRVAGRGPSLGVSLGGIGDSSCFGSSGCFGCFGCFGSTSSADSFGSFGALGAFRSLEVFGEPGSFRALGVLGDFGSLGAFGDLGSLGALGTLGALPLGSFGSLGDLDDLDDLGGVGGSAAFALDGVGGLIVSCLVLGIFKILCAAGVRIGEFVSSLSSWSTMEGGSGVSWLVKPAAACAAARILASDLVTLVEPFDRPESRLMFDTESRVVETSGVEKLGVEISGVEIFWIEVFGIEVAAIEISGVEVSGVAIFLDFIMNLKGEGLKVFGLKSESEK